MMLTVEIYWFAMNKKTDVFSDFRDARVMWDQKTGRSRGFGFVSFRNQQVLFVG